jgi:hypothetical protein
MTDPVDPDAALAFTVASVWREERISCPHPDLLASYLAESLDGGAAEFLDFHVRESQCPWCNAVLADLRAADARAREPQLDDLRDRILRSTVSALRSVRRP